MKIGNLINKYGKQYSPYMGEFINHLPMGQLALYRLSDDLEKVSAYSEKFIQMYDIEKVKPQYDKINSLDESLGNRNLYESALELISKQTTVETTDSYIKSVLNDHPLGMSSGLFHVLIRLAYAVEGFKLDESLIEETNRALAYYVTAYKKADVFKRQVESENMIREFQNLYNSDLVKSVMSKSSSLGQSMKALYSDPQYLACGFVSKGSDYDKVEASLNLALNGYLNSGSIVALHCITGLHALVVLKHYFKDFSFAVDILTTCIITHMIAANIKTGEVNGTENTDLSWKEIIQKGKESTDVHAIKLTYSAYNLSKAYDNTLLKDAALMRINRK